jgi:hypothetical protein
MNLGQQMPTSFNQEPFDLSTWIAGKLGLNIERENHKRRLEELTEAFDKAGYRTRETLNFIDDEVINDVNMELLDGKKLKGGEKRALKGTSQ